MKNVRNVRSSNVEQSRSLFPLTSFFSPLSSHPHLWNTFRVSPTCEEIFARRYSLTLTFHHHLFPQPVSFHPVLGSVHSKDLIQDLRDIHRVDYMSVSSRTFLSLSLFSKWISLTIYSLFLFREDEELLYVPLFSCWFFSCWFNQIN